MNRTISLCAIICAAIFFILSCQPTTQPDNPNDDPGNNTEQPENPKDTTGNNGPDNPTDSTGTNNPENPSEPPVLTLEAEQVSASFFGEKIQIAYTVQNPVEGGVLTVTIPESNDWITANVDKVNSTIKLTISDNISQQEEARSEVLTAVYTYGEESVKAYFNVIQEGVVYDFRHEIETAEFIWYNPKGDLANYYIIMKDVNGVKIDFDLFSEVWTEDQLPAEGVYVAAECNQETSFTYCNYCTYIMDNATNYITDALSGDIIIKREDANIIINALLTDDKGAVHLIIYKNDDNGPINGTIESNLASDWNATVDGAAAGGIVLWYHGSGYTANSNTWKFQIWPLEGTKPKDYVFFGEIYTSKDVNFNTGLGNLVLTMDAEDTGAPNTYSEGVTGYMGSWLLQVHSVENNIVTYGAQTPIKDGTITFTLNDDGTYDIQLNVLDDNTETPHQVNILFENTPIEYINETGKASASRKSMTMKRAR